MLVDLSKGKEQVGWWSLTLFNNPTSIIHHTSYHEHDTEKYREIPGVPVRKVENWDLGLHSLTSMPGNPA